jgi:hypothetical protein
VTSTEAIALLEKFRAGQIPREQVLHAFQAAPLADLGFAQVDTHRALRKNFPEVIFGEGKTPAQVASIAAKITEREACVLITRVNPEHARAVRKKIKSAVYHQLARCITFEHRPLPKRAGIIAVLAAGTSDLPVAEEAAVTADIMGNRGSRFAPVPQALERRPERQCDHCCGRHGRSIAQRGGGFGQQAHHCRAHKHWVWGKFWRISCPIGHAEQLRQRPDHREYR